ncbi:iron ABC transporter permease [Paenibacillus sp. FSL W8-0439]|uniref:FecCD family ABC transporter permease n=1 Tax=Paenibacillus sp. FSL W8-0439 TaxID=2921716 RepID=UPI0030FA2AC0
MQFVRRKHAPLLAFIILILICIVFILSLNSGSVSISPHEVWSTLLGKGTPEQNLTLFELRLPRMVIALLIGCGLAISGAIMQGLSRNDLADPGLMGVHAGSGLAVVLLMYLVFQSGTVASYNAMSIPIFAFVGALLTALIIYALAWRKGILPIRLILVGLAVGEGLRAIYIILSLKLSDEVYMGATVWLAGSLTGTGWPIVIAILPWITILSLYAFYNNRYLDALSFGESTTTSIGVKVNRERLKFLLVSVGLAGACVAAGGGIGFIGLMAPHIARKLVGSKYKVIIPISALIGALLLLLCDWFARTILPRVEVPAGILVSLVGAPYFLYLLLRSK